MILRAVHATLHRCGRGRAGAAGFQILQSLHELALQIAMSADRLAGLLQLALEQAPQLFHRGRSLLRAPPVPEHASHLLEREPEAVQQIDPAHPLDCARVVEAEAAARAGGRLEQPQLLVEMDRSRTLAGGAREVSDPEEVGPFLCWCAHLIKPSRKG